MGRHTACMPVRVTTARGSTVEEVVIRMTGSALVPGEKVRTLALVHTGQSKEGDAWTTMICEAVRVAWGAENGLEL